MRVVHVVCSTGFAGVERYIVTVAAGLANRGADVTVVGGSRSHMVPALEGTGVAWLPGDDMRQALRSLRATGHMDVLHTHMSQADLVGWIGRRGRKSTRHVSTRHFAGSRGTGTLARAAFAPIGRSLDAEIAISRFVAEHVERPAQVVYSGVEDQPSSTERAPFVLAAQRLEPEKHTSEVIEAWALSDGPAAGWMLRIAGDGSEWDRLHALTHERGVADSVEFLGHRTDIPDLLSRAAVVIAPTPREGLGILVLESMAHATPVVAAAGGGHLESVGVAQPDLLYPPGDALAAAQLLDRLVADPELRLTSGAALQRLQRERFTIEAQIAGVQAVYDRLLA
ncbi:glycosyltransferase family 4 protein [Microbacterium sp. CFH 31415]|uniref:glycosyltransferase family 4 protein n=1 Tax=Microbacterium sp. CFH 31415 TaxID=2921732 RepID=UPI001F131580|nr:glycosyltransferase family 4 protein [Microbacterium sp. CFH 31415]MCH6230775.1 glycosyltransferase family 4 protein [Microbacterium sp. CFH 31415]